MFHRGSFVLLTDKKSNKLYSNKTILLKEIKKTIKLTGHSNSGRPPPLFTESHVK